VKLPCRLFLVPVTVCNVSLFTQPLIPGTRCREELEAEHLAHQAVNVSNVLAQSL